MAYRIIILTIFVVFILPVAFCVADTPAIPLATDSPTVIATKADLTMTQMLKDENGDLYLPLSYLAKALDCYSAKYIGEDGTGKVWIIKNGVKVEFMVPNEEDNVNDSVFTTMSVNGISYNINRQIALATNSKKIDAYVLGKAMAKALGYIQQGTGITMASVWYEPNTLKITESDLTVRSAKGDIIIGKADFFSIYNMLGTPNSLAETTSQPNGKMTYNNGLFLDLKLNSTSNKWVSNHADIRSANYWTVRGVKIGNSSDVVLKMYGNDYFQVGERFNYSILSNYWQQKGISFTIVEGLVKEIDIYYRDNAK